MLPQRPRLHGGGRANEETDEGLGVDLRDLMAAVPAGEPEPLAISAAAFVSTLEVGQVLVGHAPESPWHDNCFRSGCSRKGDYTCCKCVRSYCSRCLSATQRRNAQCADWVCPGRHEENAVADFEQRVLRVPVWRSLWKPWRAQACARDDC